MFSRKFTYPFHIAILSIGSAIGMDHSPSTSNLLGDINITTTDVDSNITNSTPLTFTPTVTNSNLPLFETYDFFFSYELSNEAAGDLRTKYRKFFEDNGITPTYRRMHMTLFAGVAYKVNCDDTVCIKAKNPEITLGNQSDSLQNMPKDFQKYNFYINNAKKLVQSNEEVDSDTFIKLKEYTKLCDYGEEFNSPQELTDDKLTILLSKCMDKNDEYRQVGRKKIAINRIIANYKSVIRPMTQETLNQIIKTRYQGFPLSIDLKDTDLEVFPGGHVVNNIPEEDNERLHLINSSLQLPVISYSEAISADIFPKQSAICDNFPELGNRKTPNYTPQCVVLSVPDYFLYPSGKFHITLGTTNDISKANEAIKSLKTVFGYYNDTIMSMNISLSEKISKLFNSAKEMLKGTSTTLPSTEEDQTNLIQNTVITLSDVNVNNIK